MSVRQAVGLNDARDLTNHRSIIIPPRALPRPGGAPRWVTLLPPPLTRRGQSMARSLQMVVQQLMENVAVRAQCNKELLMLKKSADMAQTTKTQATEFAVNKTRRLAFTRTGDQGWQAVDVERIAALETLERVSHTKIGENWFSVYQANGTH